MALDFPASIECFRGALPQFICPQMTDTNLTEIAANDSPEFELHLKALHAVCESMKVEGRLDWNPKEALELERWEVPSTHDGHLRRLFACAVLNDAYFEAQSRDHLHSLSDILAPLVDSALFMGNSAVIPARSSISALLSTPFPWWEDSLVFAGLAWIVLSVAETNTDDSESIERVCDWVVAEDHRLKLLEISAERGPGLLGCTHFSQRHSLWQAMAQRYLLNADLPYAVQTSEKLRAIGTDLVGWANPA
ncbi:MAG: hypothetical protein KF805_07515 [Phycisphaeraceae bacterium]|nr:hypothetical protein [Phycisphaeraceae bacterium]